MKPLVHEFTVACAAEHAWTVWAERTSLWWPATHSVSGAPEAVAAAVRDGGTTVRIEHRGWERLGSRGAELRERNVRGWAGLLPAYVSATDR